MTVSMPRFESDTFRPKRHPCSVFMPSSAINDWTISKSMPSLKIHALVSPLVSYTGGGPFLYKNLGSYVISEVVGALVVDSILRTLVSRGPGIESHGLPFLIHSYKKVGACAKYSGGLNWRNGY
jgi:hypothetical protein